VASFTSSLIQSIFGKNVKGLLDLVCGPGHLTAEICRKINISGSIFGIDFVKENIERSYSHGVYTQLHNIDVLQFAARTGLIFDANMTFMNDFLYYLSIDDQSRLVKLLDKANVSGTNIYVVTTRLSHAANFSNKNTPYPTLGALDTLFANIDYTLAHKKQWSCNTYTLVLKILRKLRSLGVSSRFVDIALLRLTCFIDEIIDKSGLSFILKRYTNAVLVFVPK
jgi:hypothetical protein